MKLLTQEDRLQIIQQFEQQLQRQAKLEAFLLGLKIEYQTIAGIVGVNPTGYLTHVSRFPCAVFKWKTDNKQITLFQSLNRTNQMIEQIQDLFTTEQANRMIRDYLLTPLEQKLRSIK